MSAVFRRRPGGRLESLGLPAIGALAPTVAVALAATTTLGIFIQLASPTGLITGGLPTPWWLPAANLTAASCVLMTAAVSRGRARGPMGGLVLMLAALLLPSWAAWPVTPAAAGVALLASSPLLVAGVALVAAIRRSREVLVLTGIACAVLALAYNPFADLACWESCSDLTPPLAAWLSTAKSITVATVLTIAAIGVVGVGLVRGRTRASGAVVAGSAVALALLTATSTLRLLGWPGRPALVAERLLPALAVTIAAAAALIAEIRLARIRLAMERLVAGLAAPGSQVVTAGIGVRSVLFAVSDSGRWVDESGRNVPAPDGPCLTLSGASGPTVLLRLASQADEAGVLAGLTPGARLALQNAQLTAVGKARLAEVQESRRRIVTTSDAERRRIERDLHDGAQQRLVSAALHLQVAMARLSPPASEALRDAEAQVRRALARLRGLAHGVAPALLAEDGLAAALEDLAAGSEVAMSLDLQIAADLDPDAAMAAYCTVADTVTGGVAEPAAGTVEVRVRHDEGRLTVRLLVPAGTAAVQDAVSEAATALGDADDRVGALGGSLLVRSLIMDSDGCGIEVTAVIPCEWS